MASLSQMTSLNPADIFTKLKFLAGIVFGMFGFMHVLGGLVYALNARERAALVARLTSKSTGFGFRQHAGTCAWTWRIQEQDISQEASQPAPASHTIPSEKMRRDAMRCHTIRCDDDDDCFQWGGGARKGPKPQLRDAMPGCPMRSRYLFIPDQARCDATDPARALRLGARQVGNLSGPIAELARVVGCPAVRLRAAIPEELLGGTTMAGAVGRSAGDLSAGSLQSTARHLARRLSALTRGVPRRISTIHQARPASFSRTLFPHAFQYPFARVGLPRTAPFRRLRGHPLKMHCLCAAHPL